MKQFEYWMCQIMCASIIIMSFYIKGFPWIPLVLVVAGLVGVVHQIQRLRQDLNQKRGKK